MIGRLAAVGIVVGLAAGGLGAGTADAAAKPVFAATGDVHCTGGVKLKAAMIGSAPNYHVVSYFKGKLTCSGTTGNSSVFVARAKVFGAFNHTGGCTITGVHDNSFPSQTTVHSISLIWKAKGGKLDPTDVRYSNHDASIAGWQLPASSPAGTSHVSGSYAGTGTSTAFIQTAAISSMESHCGGKKLKTGYGASVTIDL